MFVGVYIVLVVEVMVFGVWLGLNIWKLFNVIFNCGGIFWYVLFRFCGISFFFFIFGRVCGIINGNSIFDVYYFDVLYNFR